MIFDALIVGAGPAGATMALLLARAGWSVAMVEKEKFPRPKVCGEFISATCLPLMHEIGILDFFNAHAGPEVKRVGLFAANSIVSAAMPAAKSSLGSWGRALPREHLDEVLLELAKHAGAVLWQPWRAAGVITHKTHVSCTLTSEGNQAEISARFLITANGSWERGLISSIDKVHKPSDLLAFKARFRHCALDEDLMNLLCFPGGYGGLVHSDSERVTLSCCIRRDRLKEIRANHPGLLAADAVLAHIKSSCLGAERVFSKALREGSWLSAGPLQPGIRSCYADRQFYLGNIAGEAHPIIAEGISMAMQSAWILSRIMLAQKYNAVTDFEKIGQAYQKQWRSQFSNRIHAAALFMHIANRPQLMKLFLPIFERFPNLVKSGAILSGKIKGLAFP